MIKKHFRCVLVFPILNRIFGSPFLSKNCWNYATVEQMGEWTMTKVMHDTGHGYVSNVVQLYIVVFIVLCEPLVQLTSNIIQELHLFLGQMSNSKTVSKSGMSGSWENVIKCSQLVQIFESSIHWIINVFPKIKFEFNSLSVYRVFDVSTHHSIIRFILTTNDIWSIVTILSLIWDHVIFTYLKHIGLQNNRFWQIQ